MRKQGLSPPGGVKRGIERGARIKGNHVFASSTIGAGSSNCNIGTGCADTIIDISAPGCAGSGQGR